MQRVYKHVTKYSKCYTENEVISMLEFLIEHICRIRKGTCFNKSSASPWKQTVPLSLTIFSCTLMRIKYSKTKRMADTLAFNHTFNYVYDVLTINNLDFGNWIPLIYNEELEIKEITETADSSSFLGIYLKFG